MKATSSAHHDIIAKLVPGGVPSLAHLSDQDLLTSTRRLVGKSNQVFAALLLHLAEVEARGIHRLRLCASLYTYCVYELRFSEDAAARRSSAARLVKQFPILFEAVANAELHFTGLLMIGPHLTPENHVEVLGRAKFRTKKELAKLVRELNPLPRVPALIQPLRAVPAWPTTRPSWAKLVASWEPPVRELPAGQRPCEWANDAHDDSDLTAMEPGAALARLEAWSGSESVTRGAASTSLSASDSASLDTAEARAPAESSTRTEARLAVERDPLPPAPRELPPITGPQQYQMQFTTSEEHVQLVERAKTLVARERPGVSLAELHVEAMKLLVASLEKRKFAVTDRARKRPSSSQHSAPSHRTARHDPSPPTRGVTASPTASSSRPTEAGCATGRRAEPEMSLKWEPGAGTGTGPEREPERERQPEWERRARAVDPSQPPNVARYSRGTRGAAHFRMLAVKDVARHAISSCIT